ncbi:MAG: hypothetical protein R3F02_17120 [Thiolinea sp.]
MRINARLDDSFEEKFQYIQQTENKNRSEVVKEALERYFAVKLQQKKQTALEKNQEIRQRLSGKLSGSKTGSVHYKQEIKEYLDDKFPAG